MPRGDEHGKLLSIKIWAALGGVIPQPATVHIERINGTLRDRLNALTRKTHAPSPPERHLGCSRPPATL